MVMFGLIYLSERTETVKRLNHGILFKKENPVFIASDFWYQSFKIEYPLDIAMPSIIPFANEILLLYTMNVIVFLTILLLYTFHRVRKLSTALLIIQQVQQVKGLPSTVPSFIYKPKTAAPQLSQSLSLDLKWEHSNFVLLLLILILIAIYLFKKNCKSKNSTVCLEISNNDDCVLLDIIRLPRCPSSYQLSMSLLQYLILTLKSIVCHAS